jgi:hypothetical protein
MALSFRIALVGCVVVAGAAGAAGASILAALHRALASVDGDRLLNHVKALASDEFGAGHAGRS